MNALVSDKLFVDKLIATVNMFARGRFSGNFSTFIRVPQTQTFIKRWPMYFVVDWSAINLSMSLMLLHLHFSLFNDAHVLQYYVFRLLIHCFELLFGCFTMIFSFLKKI